jgi:adenine C2-methylase RlmN of 23S rRNA A2503 and tRNA A37
MRELLFSDDKTVTKIVHDDNSETAIKTVSSCDTCITASGTFAVTETDRNKYSVFISDSVGCYMKCKFCYLTLKEMKYKKLHVAQIYNNVAEAIDTRALAGNLPPIQDKYVKLCWMGMGDAFTNTARVSGVSESLMDHVMLNKLAKGLDGIDLSTVMPSVKNAERELANLRELDHTLQKYPLNPHNDIVVHRDSEFSNSGIVYPQRSRFRIFYSLHSAVQATRENLIPHAMPITDAIDALLKYSEGNRYNVIFHYMFIDGFNDSDKEVTALINLIDSYALHDYELRILRYNTCNVSTFMHESNRFGDIIARLMTAHPHVKVQVSAGSEIKASCGQFLTLE